MSEPNQNCPSMGYQALSVCVPVKVTPYANTGSTVTKCCGTPTVNPGQNTCSGSQNGSCFFTLSQDIVVGVPIDFGADATVGDTYVNCIEASGTDIECQDLP